MNKKLLSLFLAGFCLFALGACTDDNDSDDHDNEAQPSPTGTPNPIAQHSENFRDGPGGNLWKPVSENNGNIVVLFNASYRSLFSKGCFIEKIDGTREYLYCGGNLHCFTNPNRLTLRSNIKCSQAKEVKVICEEEQQEVTFTVDETLRNQVCERHD